MFALQRSKYGPAFFIFASATEASKSISLKSAKFYGRLNRSSWPGEPLSRLPATSSITWCPQPTGQHPRISTCKLSPSVNIRKIVCPAGEITNRLSGVCLFDIWLTELSNFCPHLHAEAGKCVFSSPLLRWLSQCAEVLEQMDIQSVSSRKELPAIRPLPWLITCKMLENMFRVQVSLNKPTHEKNELRAAIIKKLSRSNGVTEEPWYSRSTAIKHQFRSKAQL